MELSGTGTKQHGRLASLLATHPWIVAAGLIALLALAAWMAFPRTTIRMAVRIGEAESVQAGRGLTFTTIREYLEHNGAHLEFEPQLDRASEKDPFEYAVGNPNIDFVLARNTGGKLPPDVVSRFASLGTVRSTPVLFFVRAGETRIRKLKDLRGKKIISASSPEGSDKPLFAPGAQASPYSSDFTIMQVLKVAGVDGSNSTLVNPYPRPIGLQDDWDVWIKASVPTQQTTDNTMWDDLLAGRIELLRLEDLAGAARALPAMKFGVMPASALVPAHAIPATDIPYLSATVSALVRKDLDPGMVVLLCEALRKVYSPQSLLSAKGEYPNFSQSDAFQPHPAAEEFYRKGRPPLGDYLTPMLAIFIMKLLLVVVPVLTVAWPLTHFLPSFYQFYIKHVLARWYAQLEVIDKNCARVDEATRTGYLAVLERLAHEMQELRFPVLHLHNVKELYSVRGHLEVVRGRVKAATAAQAQR